MTPIVSLGSCVKMFGVLSGNLQISLVSLIIIFYILQISMIEKGVTPTIHIVISVVA